MWATESTAHSYSDVGAISKENQVLWFIFQFNLSHQKPAQANARQGEHAHYSYLIHSKVDIEDIQDLQQKRYQVPRPRRRLSGSLSPTGNPFHFIASRVQIPTTNFCWYLTNIFLSQKRACSSAHFAPPGDATGTSDDLCDLSRSGIQNVRGRSEPRTSPLPPKCAYGAAVVNVNGWHF